MAYLYDSGAEPSLGERGGSCWVQVGLKKKEEKLQLT